MDGILNNPEAYYNKEIDTLTVQLNRLLKRKTRLGWLRIMLFVAAVFLIYKAVLDYGVPGWIAVFVVSVLFLATVSVDVTNNQKIEFTKILIRINKEELLVLQGHYQSRFNGEQYQLKQHAYANDLDIFGHASLFQLLNRCTTEQGQNQLASNLLFPLAVGDITKRQAAVKEVAPLLQWRQQFGALAIKAPVTSATQHKIKNWLQHDGAYFTHPAWAPGIIIYCILTISSAVLALAGILSTSVFSFLFLLFFAMASFLSKKATNAYYHLNGIVGEISSLFRLITCVEDQDFQTIFLNELQQNLKTDGEKASLQIKKLKAILERFDLRLNMFVFFFINSFLLWDVQQIRALNRWKKRNKNTVAQWFEVIAEVEVIHSLATLHFNNPDWCFPEVNNNFFSFEATALGHPLLPKEQRVNNNFFLNGVAQIGLITGSNMAGKSTFLRSIGVNIVLAQMGSPVCARSFSVSPVQLMSSMRIADNLADNTSTFYAELKKLKTIIEAVNTHQPVFILLDEILRGTNSLDRHTGSEALLKQLIQEDAIAVIATHDVELAQLQKLFPASIHNYHFDVQVKGEELYFDYILKKGICTSLNASILMKKIGLHVD